MKNSMEFIPFGMPAVYFEHEKNTLAEALCISDKRNNELKDGLTDLVNNHKALKIPFDKFSEKIEACLNLCLNEQERVLMLIQLGQIRQANEQRHPHMPMITSDRMPQELRDFLKQMFDQFGGKPDSED